MALKTIVFTTTASFTVPADWNDTGAFVEILQAGEPAVRGNGGEESVFIYGGRGGTYTKHTSLGWEPGEVKDVTVNGLSLFGGGNVTTVFNDLPGASVTYTGGSGITDGEFSSLRGFGGGAAGPGGYGNSAHDSAGGAGAGGWNANTVVSGSAPVGYYPAGSGGSGFYGAGANGNYDSEGAGLQQEGQGVGLIAISYYPSDASAGDAFGSTKVVTTSLIAGSVTITYTNATAPGATLVAATSLITRGVTVSRRPWTPLELGSRLRAWHDANDLTTITKDGSNKVSQWNDKSSNARNYTQADTTKQPTWRTSGGLSNGFGGRGMIYGARAAWMERTETSVPTEVFFTAQCPGGATTEGLLGVKQSGSVNLNIRTHNSNLLASIATWDGTTTTEATVFMTGSLSVWDARINADRTLTMTKASGGTLPQTSTTSTAAATIRTGAVSQIVLAMYDGTGAIVGAGDNDLTEIVETSGALTEDERDKLRAYLAWRAGLQSLLPDANPYKSAAPTVTVDTSGNAPGSVIVVSQSLIDGGIGAAWTMASLSNQDGAWFDGSDSSTITMATGVSQWADKWAGTGEVNNATQATGGSQPARNANGSLAFNSKSLAIAHDYTTNKVMCDDWTIAIVMRTTQASTLQGSGTWYNCPGLIYGETGGVVADAAIVVNNGKLHTGIGGDTGVIGTKLLTDGKYHLAVSTRNGTTGAVAQFVDSTADGAYTGATGARNNIPSMLIGGNGFIGDIAEIVMINAVLTAGERQKLEAFLAKKWDAINGNTDMVTALDASNPWKSVPIVTISRADGQILTVATGISRDASAVGLPREIVTYPVAGTGPYVATFTPPVALTTQSLGWANYNLRVRVPASAITISGGTIKLKINGTYAHVTNDVFIGEAAASGDLYDFAAAPTRVTFGGANGYTASGTQIVSDTITFALDETKTYLVAFKFASGAIATGGTSGQAYWKFNSGASEAQTIDVTGYTSSTYWALIDEIDVQGSGPETVTYGEDTVYYGSTPISLPYTLVPGVALIGGTQGGSKLLTTAVSLIAGVASYIPQAVVTAHGTVRTIFPYIAVSGTASQLSSADGSASGGTIVTTPSLIAGAASAVVVVTAPGALLIETASVIAGAVSSAASTAGATLPATTTLIPGAMAGNATAAGDRATTTLSLTAGTAVGAVSVPGQMIVVATGLIAGLVTGVVNIAGQTLVETDTLIPGDAAVSSRTSAVILPFTPSLIRGDVTIDAPVSGKVIHVDFLLPENTIGQVRGDASTSADVVAFSHQVFEDGVATGTAVTPAGLASFHASVLDGAVHADANVDAAMTLNIAVTLTPGVGFWFIGAPGDVMVDPHIDTRMELLAETRNLTVVVETRAIVIPHEERAMALGPRLKKVI